MLKVCILARVSTQIQDYDRQVNELSAYAQTHQMEIVKVFANKVSGAKRNEERPEIVELINYVKTEKVDRVLTLEISRLGRNTLEALKVIELLNQHKICLFVKNYGIETLDNNGNINAMAQFLITILLEVSRMERTTIKQRMDSGYANFRASGGKVGRKIGFCKSPDMMRDEYVEEIKMLKKGYSYQHINQITKTNKNTLTRLKKLFMD